MFRSPLAAALLARGARQRGKDFEIESAGLDAPSALPAALEARELAAEFGCDLDLHVTQQVRPEQVVRADLVLVMEPSQAEEIQGYLSEPERTRVECLAIYLPKHRGREASATILDPAGKLGVEARRVAIEIVEATETFLDEYTS